MVLWRVDDESIIMSGISVVFTIRNGGMMVLWRVDGESIIMCWCTCGVHELFKLFTIRNGGMMCRRLVEVVVLWD
jgi:hypothetical protein